MPLFRTHPVVVLTGADGGIGRAIEAQLAEAGAVVVGCDMGRPAPYNFDVRDREGWRAMFRAVIAEHGRVDALLANAGVQTAGTDTVVDLEDEEWQRVMDINVTAARLGMATAIEHFGTEGGRIVVTASVSGYRAFPAGCVYSTSKAAVIALVRQAALDYSHRGIYINAIAPGMMENTMHAGKGSGARDHAIASSLTGEAVTREEIATTVAYLLDERITSPVGSVIEVDGGFGLPKGGA